MEDVLEIYKGTYDTAHPLICMDESSKQQTKEVRPPLPASPGSVEKYDTEYERNGGEQRVYVLRTAGRATARHRDRPAHGGGLGAPDQTAGG